MATKITGAEAESAGTVSAWRRKGSDGSYQSIEIPDQGASSEGLARLFSRVPVTGQEEMGTD